MNSRSAGAKDIETGRLIRRLRKAKNLSQEELGGLVELSGTQIGKYERGESRMAVSMLERLLAVLGAEFSEGQGFAETQRSYEATGIDVLGLERKLRKLRRQVDDCLEMIANT